MHKSRSSWLWWLALLILLSGSGIAYWFHQQPANPAASQWFRLIVSFTAVGVGICIIAATADWWLRR